MNKKLIAWCGMNCGICYAYLREKNRCPGCRYLNKNMPISIANCKIRNCKYIKNKEVKFCFECNDFPCKPLLNLDKRYRTKYQMSEIENLKIIKDQGLEKFLKWQELKYKCKQCGGIICVHKKKCLNCDNKQHDQQ